MKIYILDDDQNIIRILEQIISDKNMGNIVGSHTSSLKSIVDIKALEPDIIIVDLLMPEMDGISLIERVREFNQSAKFIMISQVTSKEMISKAYEKGVTFYINKPINAIEVINVLTEVVKNMTTDRRLEMIKAIIGHEPGRVIKPKSDQEKLDDVFKTIGILSLSATEEIIEIIEFMINNVDEVRDYSVREICEEFTTNPKTLEQKIRRTAMNSLENLAYLGIEDNLNGRFLEFSNTLFNFKEIKIEMDFIRGETKKRGKVNVRKFLDGLIYYVMKN
jgi:two-component system response regulator YcbB